MTKPNSIYDLLQDCPKNATIADNLIRAWAKINSPKYKKIVCTISGGSDSDVMLDIVWHCDKDNKVDYVWFDTGMEYEATKDHLKHLEAKYGIEIKPHKAIKPIPAACKEYGQPFLSKQVSEFIMRLQRHNFQWQEDGWKDYDSLIQKYPRCQSALHWWCNVNQSDKFNIRNNKWLKEYMIAYLPEFLISNKCCWYAKKDVLHKLLEEGDYDLNIFGVRKAEGGARSAAYKNCFTENDNGCDSYRPLFFYKDSDKEEYVEAYCIENSACYTEYGLKRTGCPGCPYGRNFEYKGYDKSDNYYEHLYPMNKEQYYAMRRYYNQTGDDSEEAILQIMNDINYMPDEWSIKGMQPTMYGIGFLGMDKVDRKSAAYVKWHNMMSRCYADSVHKNQPQYTGCTVCEEWHNFQNFKAWFDKWNVDGYELDKDILFKGNKTYSPETYCFVPAVINSLFINAKDRRGDCPVGVYKDSKNGKYRGCFSVGGKWVKLKYWDTPEEAFAEYKEVKEKIIKECAERYRGRIDEKVYNAMMEWKIEITD